jgi:hypothetical protein
MNNEGMNLTSKLPKIQLLLKCARNDEIGTSSAPFAVVKYAPSRGTRFPRSNANRNTTAGSYIIIL